jgi:flagellar hook assembly protein FlgD
MARVLPTKLDLVACYPNPFRAMTTIRFGLPAPRRASVVVYSIDGRRVKTLLNAPLAAGHHAINWDGSDECGAFVGSGTYLYRVETGSARITRKVTLVR